MLKSGANLANKASSLLPAAGKRLARRYREFFSQPGSVVLVASAFFALFVAWWVNYFAIALATERASNSVTDIVLSNIPLFEVDGFFVYGTFIFTIVTCGIILARPRRIAFAFLAVALFWIIRSLLTTLTHLAPYEPHDVSDFGPAINKMFFGGDRFFSAHTGMPFLGALAFWKSIPIRIFYLLGSAYFGVVVLLGHLHYSIDVAAAFFITYAIYHIAVWAFPRAYALFHEDDRTLP